MLNLFTFIVCIYHAYNEICIMQRKILCQLLSDTLDLTSKILFIRRHRNWISTPAVGLNEPMAVNGNHMTLDFNNKNALSVPLSLSWINPPVITFYTTLITFLPILTATTSPIPPA